MPTQGTSAENGLILFHLPISFYSQKVFFALQEKKLKFCSHYVKLSEGEHLRPWFLKMNPKGLIPVLKDGVKVIPESDSIIDYLEDNFSNGDTPRLKPDKGTKQYQIMERFQQEFEKIHVPIITFGCVLHPQLTKNMKMSSAELATRRAFLIGFESKFEELQYIYPEYGHIYSEKKEKFLTLKRNVEVIDNVKAAINALGLLLDKAEKQLASNNVDPNNRWLCGDKFTVVDITLGLILHRVSYLGLWEQYFANKKLPFLNCYFKRLETRESFKKTINQSPGIMEKFCYFRNKNKFSVCLSSAMIIIGVASVIFFIMKRKK